MKRILFVCHGNICRSTMAQCVFQNMVNQNGLQAEYFIDSAATSREELGNGIYMPARRKLQQMGVPILPHVSRLICAADYRKFDYIIGMDESNLRNMRQVFANDPEGKCFLLLELVGKARGIADPWYSGDFDAAYRDIAEGCAALLKKTEER